MFPCAAANCKPCGSADPKVDTVKVDANLLGQRGKENAKPRSQKDATRAEAERREREARLQAERIEAQRRHLQEEEERQRRRQRELQEEQARRQAEEAARKAREEAIQCERDQREAEESARRRHQVEEAEKQRTVVHRRKVDDFLKANGFSGVNVKRRSMFKSFYPLHVAVSRKDAEMAALLLWAGADVELKNSSGQTALQLAQKNNKQSSHNAVIQALAGPLH